MFPNILGFEDSSYVLMVIMGLIAAFTVFAIYCKKRSFDRNTILDLLICGTVAVLVGLVSAVLFQNLYDLIKYGSEYRFSLKMTFYGGLFGGVLTFLLIFIFYIQKHHQILLGDILIIAPSCITLAHGLGRIGCFLAGCCYGKHTDSWIGMNFPGLGKVIPTQLIEAIFLLLLSVLLLYLAFKKKYLYSMFIYLGAYAIFRFVIEFFRGDGERGSVILGMYPSQIWCLIIIAVIIPLLFIFRKRIFVSTFKKEN